MAAVLALLLASTSLAAAAQGPAVIGKPLACAKWAGKDLCNPGLVTTISVTADGGGGKNL